MIKLSIALRKLGFSLTKTLLNLNFKITIKGQENIPEATSALIVANHISYLDVFMVGLGLYDKLINLRWVISKENYRMWYLRWLYWLYRVIVVNGTVEKAKKAIKEDCWVVIFPEGAKRWCFPREADRYKASNGAAAIALSTGIPIIPVGLSGTEKVLPVHTFKLDTRHSIIVNIGKPFSLESVSQERIDEAALEKATAEIMKRIHESIPG